jgi:signal transduction histidine kinase
MRQDPDRAPYGHKKQGTLPQPCHTLQHQVLLFLLLTSCLLLMYAPTAAVAAPLPLMLDDSAETYPLGIGSLELFEDPSGALGIDDVSSPRMSSFFAPSLRSVANFGMSSSAFWFRFSLRSLTRSQAAWLLLLDQPVMDEVELYTPTGNGSFLVQKSGVSRPISIREIRSRSIALPLAVDQASRTYYLRARIQGRAQFPLSVMTYEEFQRHETHKQNRLTAVYGFLIAMSLVGAALLVFTREQSYLYFVLYLLSYLMATLSITGYYYAWFLPEHPLIHRTTLLIFAILMTLSGLLFTRSFLKVSDFSPPLDRLLHWLILLNTALIPGYLLTPPLYAKIAVNLMFLFATIVSGLAAYACYRKGFAPARYFLFSRLVVYAGSLAYALTNFKILPADLLPNDYMQLVLILDASFIVIALADRINTQRQQINCLVADLRKEMDERTNAHQIIEQEMAERLRLEQEVVSISDDERFKISRALHDGLCQQLTGARLVCGSLNNRLRAQPEPLALLKPLEQLLDESVDHAYSLSRGAWPIEHETQGQITSLDTFIQRISAQSGIPVVFHNQRACQECLNPQMTQLYRIAQEAITNAVKHAQAQCITVTFDCSPARGILVDIRDNGIGRTAHIVSSTGGMGIRIMAHRARSIGGELEIQDLPEGGTAVICRVSCTTTKEQPVNEQHSTAQHKDLSG